MFTIKDAHEPRRGHKSHKDGTQTGTAEDIRCRTKRAGMPQSYAGKLHPTKWSSSETLVSVHLIIQSGPVVGKQKHFANDRIAFCSLSRELFSGHA